MSLLFNRLGHFQESCGGAFLMANQKNTSWQNLLPAKKSNKQSFELVLQYPAVEPSPYFPKVKNQDGVVVTDEDGHPKRSQQQTGWVYTFVRFGTAEIVKVILKDKFELNPAVLYRIEGLGYNFKKERTFYIDEPQDFAVVHDLRGDER